MVVLEWYYLMRYTVGLVLQMRSFWIKGSAISFMVHAGSVKSVASPLCIYRVAVLMCAPSTIGLDHPLSPNH
jgi:hypothetical protein